MKKILVGLAGLMVLSGCLMKSKVVKSLEPVDQTMLLISQFNCGLIRDPEGYVKCMQIKVAATEAHYALNELGVNAK